MKSVRWLSLAGCVAVTTLAGASPSAAADFYGYGLPVPPRPIPNVASETVVTTTRRVVTTPGYDGFAPPQTVVTTRKVVTTGPAGPVDVLATGGYAPPPPPRPFVRDVGFAPGYGGPVVARPVAAPPPVVVEERRVENTRRIIGPPPSAEWEE